MRIVQVASSGLISGGDTEVVGYALKATADSEIIFRNGDDGAAPAFISVLLGSGQSVRDEFTRSIPFDQGLYVEIDGAVEGTVWVQ